MYTTKDLHVERITPDIPFMEENLETVKHFFEVAVLPELLGRWFSRPPERANCVSNSASTPSSSESTEVEMKYCHCGQGEFGDMIGCDNDDCTYKWFHLECLKLKTFPRAKKWYCPECRKKMKSKSKSQ